MSTLLLPTIEDLEIFKKIVLAEELINIKLDDIDSLLFQECDGAITLDEVCDDIEDCISNMSVKNLFEVFTFAQNKGPYVYAFVIREGRFMNTLVLFSVIKPSTLVERLDSILSRLGKVYLEKALLEQQNNSR